MVVRPARHHLEIAVEHATGQRLGVRDDLLAVVAEGRLQRLAEGHRLGRDHVHQRPALPTGEDGILTAEEIVGLDLRNTELVTLSACETGLGAGFFAEIPAGDDFVGLTRAFLQAGSSSVLATLWEVDDRSTVDLMKYFYRRLEEPGAKHDKAVALANAQQTLRSSGKYKHPYYWAPFVLVGSVNLNRQARSWR